MGGCGSCFEGVGKAKVEAPKIKMVVKIQDGRDKYMEMNLPADATVASVQREIWKEEMVHPKCTYLYLRGCEGREDRFLAVKEKIQDIVKDLKPEDILFDCKIQEGMAFPRSLGPFTVAKVPLQACDIELSDDVSNKKFESSGFVCEVKAEKLKEYGVGVPGTHIIAKVSPVAPISVTGTQREDLHIPPEASRFSWCYPIENWERVHQVGEMPQVRSQKYDAGVDLPTGTDAVINFIKVGGFLYFNDAGKLVSVTTVCRVGCDDGNMHFGKPKRLKPEWIKALNSAGRFQRVTLDRSVLDADYFCWVSHHDSSHIPALKDFLMPTGGFAYLIDDHPDGGNGEHNCYYPLRVMPLARPRTDKLVRESKTAPYEVTVTLARENGSNKSVGIKLVGDVNLTQLEEAIWSHLYVHPAVQRIYYQGKKLRDGDTLSACTGFQCGQFPDQLQLEVRYEAIFPQNLGPFSISEVPHAGLKFTFPQMSSEGVGDRWEMEASVLSKYDLYAWGSNLQGRMSPLWEITVQGAQRVALMIPQQATHFCFSYPAGEWPTQAGDGERDGRAAVLNFMAVGGFMYFDADGSVVGTTTLGAVAPGHQGNMSFGHPKRLRRRWTKALLDRFQPVTIKALKDDFGAKHFCWLTPGEKLKGSDGIEFPLEQQPQIPHGGFAYLFHEDPKTTKSNQVDYDCYLPVKSKLLSESSGISEFNPIEVVQSSSIRSIDTRFVKIE